MFEVVTEMIDMRTLDGCKDIMFETRAMFEVVGRALDATLEMRMLDAQELIANLGLLTNGVLTKDVDRCSDMLTKGVDGCNDVGCRQRDIVIDNVGRIMVVDNEICPKYGLRRCVDRCMDVSSMMTIIDNEIWRKYGLRRCIDACKDVSSRRTPVDFDALSRLASDEI